MPYRMKSVGFFIFGDCDIYKLEATKNIPLDNEQQVETLVMLERKNP